ncbi:Hypothetical predicted protein [Cloeon dipterum]|uniref:Uncharacterized protein n=1 Tax=Cloeon dipterum TaxID=197152 RepID=A0A8S1D342_9INSE|nr:Hypothetical predicted protein [Cloeon dipterum]
MEDQQSCLSDHFTAVLIANVVLLVANGIVLAILGVSVYRRSTKQKKSMSLIAEKPTEEPFYEPVKYCTPNDVTYEVPKEINTPVPEPEYDYVSADKATTPAGPDYLPVIG